MCAFPSASPLTVVTMSWWLVLCTAVLFQLAALSNGNWLKNFGKPKPQLRLMEGVPEHLHNVMPYEQVHFSNPNVSTDYVSSTKFQVAGMGHLYFITDKFIQYILSDQAFPEGQKPYIFMLYCFRSVDRSYILPV